MAKKLSPELKKTFMLFLEHHPPRQFSISFRRLLLDYIEMQADIGFPTDFRPFLVACYDFFELMDLAEKETV